MGISASPISLMNTFGQFQALAGIQNNNAAMLNTMQNQMNFLGQLPQDTFELINLAEADKKNALAKSMYESKMLAYQQWYESLKKASQKEA